MKPSHHHSLIPSSEYNRVENRKNESEHFKHFMFEMKMWKTTHQLLPWTKWPYYKNFNDCFGFWKTKTNSKEIMKNTLTLLFWKLNFIPNTSTSSIPPHITLFLFGDVVASAGDSGQSVGVNFCCSSFLTLFFCPFFPLTHFFCLDVHWPWAIVS